MEVRAANVLLADVCFSREGSHQFAFMRCPLRGPEADIERRTTGVVAHQASELIKV